MEEFKLNDIYKDLMLDFSVQVGSRKVRLKDIASNLQIGSIISLDKIAGEDLDILVNGKLIATGELVIINENYGIKINRLVE